MHVEKWTFLLQTVNFAVLVWLLHRFLYKPVLAVIAARRAEIDKQYAQAAAKQEEANAQLAAIEAERSRMLSDREALLSAAAKQADDAATARHARAEREAATLIEAARKGIAVERVAALAEVRRIALDMGGDIARQLLAEMPIRLRAEGWLERVEQHLAGLSLAEREALVLQSSNARVHVVAAAPLPPESAATWRTRLRQILGERVVVDFSSNPALIAGVELHFPGAILRFTWQSTLAALRGGLDATATSANHPAGAPYADAR
jgi:F-type H+-transporting ATPase subunit b